MNESCHHEWVMSYINESCHIWMRHVTYERVRSYMNEAYHIWMSHVTCDVGHVCISRAKCFFGESTYDCRMRHVRWPQRALEYVYDWQKRLIHIEEPRSYRGARGLYDMAVTWGLSDTHEIWGMIWWEKWSHMTWGKISCLISHMRYCIAYEIWYDIAYEIWYDIPYEIWYDIPYEDTQTATTRGFPRQKRPIAIHYNTLQHTATHCNTLPYASPRIAAAKLPGVCSTFTATRCNTATHCNTYMQHARHAGRYLGCSWKRAWRRHERINTPSPGPGVEYVIDLRV